MTIDFDKLQEFLNPKKSPEKFQDLLSNLSRRTSEKTIARVYSLETKFKHAHSILMKSSRNLCKSHPKKID